MPEAKALLGEMYRWGRGCAQDYEQARRWYSLAAQQGIASAQFGLGDIYYQGLGVTVDVAAAADWYQKAADKGDARGQVALAIAISHRQGQAGRTRRRPDDCSSKPRSRERHAAYTMPRSCICAAMACLEPRQGGNLFA